MQWQLRGSVSGGATSSACACLLLMCGFFLTHLVFDVCFLWWMRTEGSTLLSAELGQEAG